MTSSNAPSGNGSGLPRSATCRSASSPSRRRACSSIPVLESKPVTMAPRSRSAANSGPEPQPASRIRQAGHVPGKGQDRGPRVIGIYEAGLVLGRVRLSEDVIVVDPGRICRQSAIFGNGRHAVHAGIPGLPHPPDRRIDPLKIMGGITCDARNVPLARFLPAPDSCDLQGGRDRLLRFAGFVDVTAVGRAGLPGLSRPYRYCGVRAGTQPRSPNGALTWPDGCGIYPRSLYRYGQRGVPGRCARSGGGRECLASCGLRGGRVAVA